MIIAVKEVGAGFLPAIIRWRGLRVPPGMLGIDHIERDAVEKPCFEPGLAVGRFQNDPVTVGDTQTRRSFRNQARPLFADALDSDVVWSPASTKSLSPVICDRLLPEAAEQAGDEIQASHQGRP